MVLLLSLIYLSVLLLLHFVLSSVTEGFRCFYTLAGFGIVFFFLCTACAHVEGEYFKECCLWKLRPLRSQIIPLYNPDGLHSHCKAFLPQNNLRPIQS